MDWESALGQLQNKRARARAGGGRGKQEKQHAQGKLTARERLDILLDKDSFVEMNGFVEGRIDDFDLDKRRYAGDGVVTGYGSIRGRRVFVSSEDFTVIGGTLGEYHARKIMAAQDMAMDMGIPFISINDSGGARIEEGIDSLADNVGRLLESYNSFMDVAGNGAEPAGRRLGQEMMHIASLYQDGFASLGLSMGRNGILAFHSSTLLQSAQEPDTLRAGTEALQDFAGMLYRKTGQISLNPMEYVDKKVVAYKNPGKTHVSPYAASAYSGMLFNGYC